MPGYDDVVNIVKKHYGPFPIPSAKAMENVEKISAWLSNAGVGASGVIAAAESTDGHWYFGFSKKLQEECARKNLYGKIMIHKQIQTFCTKVDQVMFQTYLNTNPTCAEKKVISQMRAEKKTMATIGIGEHPTGNNDQRLTAHIIGGDSQRSYIGPCDSCQKAFAVFGQ